MKTVNTAWLIPLMAALVLSFPAGPAVAQDDAEAPPEPNWKNELGLSYVGTSGNTDTSSFGLDFKSERKPTPWGLNLIARLEPSFAPRQTLWMVIALGALLAADTFAAQGVLRLAGHDSLVILISDGQGADKETTRLTAQLAEHNDILGIHLYDPLRASPRPGAGRGAITDGRLQVAVDFDDNRLWDRISTDYRQEMDDLRTIFRKMSAPLLPINTADPVIDQIRRWIGRVPRGASGGRKR